MSLAQTAIALMGLTALAALSAALALRPWRNLAAGPWPALVALLPLLWNLDRLGASALVQAPSGVCLLLLMVGWPLTVLALLPAALAGAWLFELAWLETLQRTFWLGLLPASLALLGGAATRRWLPAHLMVYILARGFLVTLLALSLSGMLALWIGTNAAADTVEAHGLRFSELLLGRWLGAWGEAFITGMLTAIFVAFRPHWLATYADRLYLPR